jgi:hypothetical protein
VEDVPLSDEDYLIKEACEGSFYEFVKHAWIHLDIGKLPLLMEQSQVKVVILYVAMTLIAFNKSILLL